jgi:hypothetical protein
MNGIADDAAGVPLLPAEGNQFVQPCDLRLERGRVNVSCGAELPKVRRSITGVAV